MIKTENQGVITQIPVFRQEPNPLTKGLPLGLQAPIIDQSKEQQLLLARLNYLIANSSMGMWGPLYPQLFAPKTPAVGDLLKIGRPSFLPTGFGSSNHLIPRDSWTSPILGNLGNSLLFSTSLRNAHLKMNS